MPPKRKAAATSKASSPPKKQKRIQSFFKPKTEAAKSEAESPTSAKSSDDLSLSDLVTESGWKVELQTEFKKDYFKKIETFLEAQYKKGTEVFPPKSQIFNAFNLCPLDQLKAVIIGQDPYHDNGQAHGLCFSVKPPVAPPPSLKNMYKELSTDIPGFKAPNHGNLEAWAKQGILLLNASLTVEAHKANSHSGIGWQTFTDAVIKLISGQCDSVVFILWGGFAQKKEKLIDKKKHAIIKAAHPSPLSCTKFFGCKTFSKTNDELKKLGKKPIDWSL